MLLRKHLPLFHLLSRKRASFLSTNDNSDAFLGRHPLLLVELLSPLNPTTVIATTLTVRIAGIAGTGDTTTAAVALEDTILAAWRLPPSSSLKMSLITIPSRKRRAPS